MLEILMCYENISDEYILEMVKYLPSDKICLATLDDINRIHDKRGHRIRDERIWLPKNSANDMIYYFNHVKCDKLYITNKVAMYRTDTGLVFELMVLH